MAGMGFSERMRPLGGARGGRRPGTWPPDLTSSYYQLTLKHGTSCTRGHSTGMSEWTKNRYGLYLAIAGLAIALASAAAAVMAGAGYKWGLWTFREGFTILRWAAYGAMPAVVLCLAGLAASIRGPRSGLLISVLGLIIGLTVFLLPATYRYAAITVPAIHAITTDTEDPPAFKVLVEKRGFGANTTVYEGPVIAAKQAAAYPDIRPFHTGLAPQDAFTLALKAAEEMGWEIASVDRKSLVIEATDTTFWFGFKDDVIVRVRENGAGSRIDVRSV